MENSTPEHNHIHDVSLHPSGTEASFSGLLKHMPTGDVVMKGVATGIVVSTITQSGRSLMSKLIKNPIVMLGVGFTLGYFAHKYRKEIIASGCSISEKSKDFVLRQKENLEDLLAETEETTTTAE